MGVDREAARQWIEEGKTSLGIEFGSTRIKAVLIGGDMAPIAQGSFEWENHLENGIWTYPVTEILEGLRKCYGALREDVEKTYGIRLKTVGSMGVSAMMHGYMAFDGEGELLVPFRTWRNTITQEASEKLTELFRYNIPQRWSIAHLYQAMLKREEHLPRLRFLTTLAGYIHWKLTGEKVLGIGDASGMFPIDTEKKCYNEKMTDQFQELVKAEGYEWRLQDILPKVLLAGEEAGRLTPEGAALLDETGTLEAGVPLCPPEGDAGTGMAATNSVAVRTGNVSAGTSVFAMVVLEKELSRAEYVRLVETARRQKRERLEAALQTICATGIRVSELPFVTVEAVNRGSTGVSCKGKYRQIFFPRKLQRVLKQYIRKRKIRSGPVFVTGSGKVWDRSNLWREMKALCQEAGVAPGKVFPHNLRHLFARTYYSMKKDIAKLADILGHSSINTTRIYIISTGEEHRRQMEKLGLVV